MNIKKYCIDHKVGAPPQPPFIDGEWTFSKLAKLGGGFQDFLLAMGGGFEMGGFMIFLMYYLLCELFVLQRCAPKMFSSFPSMLDD